jgi:hypothetical protein
VLWCSFRKGEVLLGAEVVEVLMLKLLVHWEVD